MNRDVLLSYLGKKIPGSKLEASFDFPVLIVDKIELLEVMRQLKGNNETNFDFLVCETAVDKLTHFEVIYHLTSSAFHHDLEVKVILEKQEIPELSSVVEIWKSAELFECEIYDLLGIRFLDHPNLRRIFLGDEWVGFPLRKDYNDNINVVTL